MIVKLRLIFFILGITCARVYALPLCPPYPYGEFKECYTNEPASRVTARYVGEVEIYRHPLGAVYQWRKGQGVLFLTDGRLWVGEWSGHLPSGLLIKYSADKNVEESGIYKDGILVQPQYVNPKSFTRIAINLSLDSNENPIKDGDKKAKEQIEVDRQALLRIMFKTPPRPLRLGHPNCGL